ncbi:MAG: hypothetical protein NTZ72_03425 [Afipia sp.]|jgi:hypothetical protein|nr:hypothetical protein [Afipia sp.]
MSLQNRVTPFGDVVSTTHRGRFTGNRGIIHDPATRTLLNRRWSSKAWIICVCEFRGRRRKVMSRRSWTELFFLDEATAFAAGHRPCFYCRRADAVKFRDAWSKGNRSGGVSAKDIDTTLHAERLDHRVRRVHALRMPVLQLPDGAMVAKGEQSYLVKAGETWLWSFAGYRRASLDEQYVKLLTPPSTVRAFRAGYRPVFDPDGFNSN